MFLLLSLLTVVLGLPPSRKPINNKKLILDKRRNTIPTSVEMVGNEMFVKSKKKDGSEFYSAFKSPFDYMGQKFRTYTFSSVIKPTFVTAAPRSLTLKGIGRNHRHFYLFGGRNAWPDQNIGGIYLGTKNSHGDHENTLSPIIEKEFVSYHKILVYDVNQDGRLDLLACRTHDVDFSDLHGELVWLTRSGIQGDGDWVEHVIGNYCDTQIEFVNLLIDGHTELLATDTGYGKITVLSSETGRFDNPKYFSAIDVTNGEQMKKIMSVQAIDLNGDGKKDLLVAVSKIDHKSAIYAIDCHGTGGGCVRHVVNEDFVNPSAPMQTVIGNAIAFHRKMDLYNGSGKPEIIVSGGSFHDAFILKPKHLNDWKYSKQTLYKCKSEVGNFDIAWVPELQSVAAIIPCKQKRIIHFELLPK